MSGSYFTSGESVTLTLSNTLEKIVHRKAKRNLNIVFAFFISWYGCFLNSTFQRKLDI